MYAPGGTGFQAALARQRSLFRESEAVRSEEDKAGEAEEDEAEEEDEEDESDKSHDEVFPSGNLVCLQVPEVEGVFAHWPFTLPGAVITVKAMRQPKVVEVSVQNPMPTELVEVGGKAEDDEDDLWAAKWAVRPVQQVGPIQSVRPVTHFVRDVHDAKKCATARAGGYIKDSFPQVDVSLPWQPYVAPWLTPKELMFFEACMNLDPLPLLWRTDEGYQLLLTDTSGLLELAKAKLRRALLALGKDPRTALQRFVLCKVLDHNWFYSWRSGYTFVEDSDSASEPEHVSSDSSPQDTQPHRRSTFRLLFPVRILPTIRPAVDVDDLDPATGKPRRIICHGVSDYADIHTPRLVWAKMTDVSEVTLLNNPDPRFGPTTEALHPWRWSSVTSTWV
jgi:hypothetical protein